MKWLCKNLQPLKIEIAIKEKPYYVISSWKHWSYLIYNTFSDQDKVNFWGVVSGTWSPEGQSKLPPEDDEKVQHLANVMFYFFIVCIVLLLVYLICSILLIFGAMKVGLIQCMTDKSFYDVIIGHYDFHYRLNVGCSFPGSLPPFYSYWHTWAVLFSLSASLEAVLRSCSSWVLPS